MRYSMTKRGLLIVLSGPSGVGKGTVLKEIVDDPELKLAFSVSMTTRSKRPGEEEGVNYYYVTKERFNEAIQNGELLEYCQYVENSYGTPLHEVERLRNEGKNVLLEIEVQGCKQVVEKVPDALTIFIVPPSLEELEKRIRGRGTESEDVIQGRLQQAKNEIAQSENYEYVVCNDDVKEAAKKISNIIKEHMEK